MIRAAMRKVIKFLRSAGVATWLLVVVALWSALASWIPQGPPSGAKVRAWASANPLAAQAADALGLHRAYGSPIFLACIVLLALSIALCAWERTKHAMRKSRSLREAEQVDTARLVASHDIDIACDPALPGSQALSTASEALGALGIKMRRRGDVISAVSPRWTVWGSPVFHWGLLALILTLIGGNLFRSEGLMGLAIGQAKVDAPGSYGLVTSGPLYNWQAVHRSIRVDAFDPRYMSGGINRGPTPTVSVLDGSGKVVKSQRVYPNRTLNTGSLAIYPSDYGLAAVVSAEDAAGVAVYRQALLVDFSATAPSGTITNDYLGVSDSAGNPVLRVRATVPLDREGGIFVGGLPSKPTARLDFTRPDGTAIEGAVLSPGDRIQLPTGGYIRLDGIGYYARLQVVDDGSIPLLYAGAIVALVGLSVAVLARQQIVIATVVKDADAVRLVGRVRLWRNASTTREEIETGLRAALGRPEKENES